MLSGEPGLFWKVKSRTLMNGKSPFSYSALPILRHLHEYPTLIFQMDKTVSTFKELIYNLAGKDVTKTSTL